MSLLVDFENAFSNISHVAIFQELRQHLPGIYAWMEACYSAQPFLHLGSHTIKNYHGVQQGDSLDLLGFSIILHFIVTRIQSEVLNLTLNSRYLDNGILMESPIYLAATLNIIQSDGPTLGLLLNRSNLLTYSQLNIQNSLVNLLPYIPSTSKGFVTVDAEIFMGV